MFRLYLQHLLQRFRYARNNLREVSRQPPASFFLDQQSAQQILAKMRVRAPQELPQFGVESLESVRCRGRIERSTFRPIFLLATSRSY